jgi:hypothetical protein
MLAVQDGAKADCGRKTPLPETCPSAISNSSEVDSWR